MPLIVHWPAGGASFPAKVDEPARLMDVAPTILQFVGIAQPPEFQGRSLLELMRSDGSKTARDVYSESLYAHKHFGCSSLRGLRTGRYKYIEGPKPELYDLATDPGETRNLYTQQGSLALASKQKLASLGTRLRNQHPLGGKALDPDTLARLRWFAETSRGAPNTRNLPRVGLIPKTASRSLRTLDVPSSWPPRDISTNRAPSSSGYSPRIRNSSRSV